MKYVEYLNELIRNKISEKESVVVFGQNVVAGGCLGGLTKNIKVREKSLVINTQNSENTLCGVGFGLMLGKVASVYFTKQQDFLLLGIDQLVNTYNFIRRKKLDASFTIFSIIVDSGFQGLQSSLNNFGDFCSIARVPGYAITNKADAKDIISSQLFESGFRIIGVSQRLFNQELLETEKIYSNENNTVFQYAEGEDVTIVCFNFSFPYGLELQKKLKEQGKNSSLFSVNALTPVDWSEIVKDAKKTNRLVVIDDSKSKNLSCYVLINDVLDQCRLDKKIIIKRDMSGDWLSPNRDVLDINYEEVCKKLQS